MRHGWFVPLLLAAALLTGCSSRPRIPPGTIPEHRLLGVDDAAYGRQVLQQLRRQYALDLRSEPNLRVERVVERLVRAAHADDAPWHIYVFHDARVKNAAATRGNCIFIWSGMLDFAGSDGELAAVLAHELGHVLADHTQPTPDEKTREILAGASGLAARGALGAGGYGAAAGLAAQAAEALIRAAIVNPEEQRKEYEADEIGLFLLARAGYDPREAVSLWRRMSASPEFAGPGLAFMSTHPTSAKRLRHLEELLPQAEAEYRTEDSWSFGSSEERPRPGAFAWPGPPPPEPAVPRGRSAARRAQLWRAAEVGAPIFAAPNANSRRIDVLPGGTIVDVDRVEGGRRSPGASPAYGRDAWLRISKPVRGWVPRSYVVPY